MISPIVTLNSTKTYPIPGFSRYVTDEELNVYCIRHTKLGGGYSLNKYYAKGYRLISDAEEKHVHVNRSKVRKLAFKDWDNKRNKFISYRASEQGRAPFTRERAFNMILQYMPEIQVPLTPKDGKFTMGHNMAEHGILVCEECGHIQAIEIRICKGCAGYITNK